MAFRCPRCRKDKIIKSGKRITVKGKKQRFQCTLCGHVFVIRKA